MLFVQWIPYLMTLTKISLIYVFKCIKINLIGIWKFEQVIRGKDIYGWIYVIMRKRTRQIRLVDTTATKLLWC